MCKPESILEKLVWCACHVLCCSLKTLSPACDGCWSAGMQVMQMFDKAEAEYRELSEKKRIVENDKDKIRKVSAPRHVDVIVLSFGHGL